jgi:hypothetical protein
MASAMSFGRLPPLVSQRISLGRKGSNDQVEPVGWIQTIIIIKVESRGANGMVWFVNKAISIKKTERLHLFMAKRESSFLFNSPLANANTPRKTNSPRENQ